MTGLKRLLAGTALALAAVTPADAATYLFSYTGDATASWTLDSSPTPTSTGGAFFQIDNVSITINGNTAARNLQLYDSTLGGGFTAIDEALTIDAAAEPLFTGLLSSPTFKLGTFVTTPFAVSALGAGSLTISVLAVPEPANWALMIAGFGLTGAAMRRRRTTAIA